MKKLPIAIFVFFHFTGCNCFGHSDQCVYNETVDNLKLSSDLQGNYEGGGVCQNCQHNTEGYNCNKCVNGYYRPYGKNLSDIDVCQSKCEQYSFQTENFFQWMRVHPVCAICHRQIKVFRTTRRDVIFSNFQFQNADASTLTRLEIAKMELENANVSPSSQNLTVTVAVLAIMVTLCADPAIVTSTAPQLFNVKQIMGVAPVNSTTEATTAAFAPRNFIVFPNANVSVFFCKSCNYIRIKIS